MDSQEQVPCDALILIVSVLFNEGSSRKTDPGGGLTGMHPDENINWCNNYGSQQGEPSKQQQKAKKATTM